MFVYIMTLIVIALLLFVGAKAIGVINNLIYESSMVQLKKDMENKFEYYQNNPNSWEENSIFHPHKRIEKVKFFQFGKAIANEELDHVIQQ